jgi:hypothetical protein
MNDTKRKIRDHLRSLRKIKSMPGKGRRWRTVTLRKTGKVTVARPGPWKVGTPQDLDALLASWDEKLQTIGEDAQLANIDLQNQLQKQQQTIQMLSSISKILHDTAMSVIRKLGG